MLYAALLQFKTACLGDITSPEDTTRRFLRSDDHRWRLSDRAWRCITHEAVKGLRLDNQICSLAFCMPQPIELPRVDLISRAIRRGQERTSIFHEGLEEGSRITLEFHVSDTTDFSTTHKRLVQDGDIRPVAPDDVAAVLSYIGKYLGISPWGWQSGYGQFDLVELKIL